MKGEELTMFSFTYPYDGEQYSFEVVAATREEAEARVKAIPWGKYDGEMMLSIEVSDDIVPYTRGFLGGFSAALILFVVYVLLGF